MKDSISANPQRLNIVKASGDGNTNYPSPATLKPFNRMRLHHNAAALSVYTLRTSTSTTAPTADTADLTDAGRADSLGGAFALTIVDRTEYSWAEPQLSFGLKVLNAGAFAILVETWLAT